MILFFKACHRQGHVFWPHRKLRDPPLLFLKSSSVTQGERDWLPSLRSLRVQKEKQVSWISIELQKAKLGIRELSWLWSWHRYGLLDIENQASWSPLRYSWGCCVPKFHLLPHLGASGLAVKNNFLGVQFSFLFVLLRPTLILISSLLTSPGFPF